MGHNTKLQGVAGGDPISEGEAKLLAAYRATAYDARYMAILAAQAIARVSPLQRAALTLVHHHEQGACEISTAAGI